MHKYFIEIYKYTPQGALEAIPFTTQFADNEVQLRKIRDQYAYEYQTKEVTDEDGNVITEPSFKAYKVKAYKLCYKAIADLDAEIQAVFE